MLAKLIAVWLGAGVLALAQAPDPPRLRQLVRFERPGPENVFRDGDVRDILQDSWGFVWIATFQGLFRFDSYSLREYRHSRAPGSISGNEINCLFEDRQRRLWVGTRNGVNLYDRDTDSFRPFIHRENDPASLSYDDVRAVGQDRRGDIWVGTQSGGVNKLVSLEEGRFIRFDPDEGSGSGLNNSRVRSMLLDRDGTFWITANDGLYELVPGDSDEFMHRLGPSGDELFRTLAVQQDSSGALWLAVQNRVARFDPKTHRSAFLPGRLFSNDEGSEARIYDLVIDAQDRIWIASLGNGLFVWDQSQQKLNRYKPDSEDWHSLPHPRIHTLMIDDADGLWVGAIGGGVARVDIPSLGLTSFDFRDQGGRFGPPEVRAILIDQRGHWWLGTSRGLFQFGPDGTLLTHLRFGNDTIDLVFCLLEDRNGFIWAGTGELGLYKIDPRKPATVIEHYLPEEDNPQSLLFEAVWTLAEDRDGALWVGTAGSGLNRLDPATHIFTPFIHDPQRSDSLSSGAVTTLLIDDADHLWVGSNGGLSRMSVDQPGSFTHWRHDQKPDSLSHNHVEALCFDSKRRIWAGTAAGLNRLRPDGGFARYFEEDGLPNDSIAGILEDQSGRLWVSTLNGLACFDEETNRFAAIPLPAGLQVGKYQHRAAFAAKDGRLLFGGARGFNAFLPNEAPSQPPAAAPQITGLYLDNQLVMAGDADSPLSRSILETESLRLHWNQDLVSFEFNAFDFNYPRRMGFAYLMEGLDKQRVSLEAGQRYAVYNNLPGGDYQLKVWAAGPSGVWSETPTRLRVVVSPPPWRTPLAYTLYATAALAALLLLFRIQRRKLVMERAMSEKLDRQVKERTRELQEQNQKIMAQQGQLEAQARDLQKQTEKLREMDEFKTRFFTGVSHELRTPLTLTLGPLEDLLEDAQEPQRRKLTGMRRNVKWLQKLINELLDIAKLEAGQMTLHARWGNLASLVRRCARVYDSLAEENGVSLVVQVGDEPVWHKFDPEKIEKAIHNLLTNALKSTGAGGKVLTILTDEPPEDIRIAVRDTGPGIPAGKLPHIFERFYSIEGDGAFQAGTGLGLALVKELVELHDGRVDVSSEAGFGSEFAIILPRCGVPPQGLVSMREPEQAEAWAPPLSRTTESADDESAAAHSGSTVLVVEDHSEMREFIVEKLSPRFRLLTAASGDEGWRMALENLPDLIVSDVMMPGMDGFELCRRLKAETRTSHIPVILLTAKAGGEGAIEGLETGADDYLTKPFQARELITRIENLIRNRRNLRDKYRTEISAQPADVWVENAETVFLRRALEVLELRSADSAFGVFELADEMGVSRKTLHRKTRQMLGITPVAFIRSFRLKRARQLLEKDAGSVSQICYRVGYDKPQYFSALFRKEFGMSPSEYAAKFRKKSNGDRPDEQSP